MSNDTKTRRIIFKELIEPFQALPAKSVFNFTADTIERCEESKLSGAKIKENGNRIVSYKPSLRAEKLAGVFGVAGKDIPYFERNASEQNLTKTKRQELLKTLLELGLEKRVRTFIREKTL